MKMKRALALITALLLTVSRSSALESAGISGWDWI